MDEKRTRRRLACVALGAAVAAAAVVVRLVDASVVHSSRWREEAERQHQRTVTLAADRGSFLDRDGRPLAVSLPAWSAWCDPSALGTQREKRAAARSLAGELSVGEPLLRERLASRRYFAWLQRKLTPARRAAVESLGVPGVGFVKESRRVHPQGTLAAHVLGAVGMDDSGLEGLEHAMDSAVAGSPGAVLTLRDARGDDFMPGGISCVPPSRGSDVVLTIDSVVQHVAERELRAAVARTGASAGTVIVTFPGNGEILALSNHPTFNPDNFPSHPSHLRTNRAVASCYEPGSTLKMFTAVAALEARAVDPDARLDCGGGSLLVGRARVHDHSVFHVLSLTEVLAKSSNVGAMRLGQAAGAPALASTLRKFGFGRTTGSGIPGESAGILRPHEQWNDLSLASISFGQEVAVTPLQLAAAAGALANGGLLVQPRIVREIRHADGSVERPETAPPRRACSRGTAQVVCRMLEHVVTDGTGRLAAVPGYDVAGKTGTAQVIGPDGGYLPDEHVASFVGWAPAGDPAILVLVVLHGPRGAYHGGEVAAPVFAAVARDVLRHFAVPSSHAS